MKMKNFLQPFGWKAWFVVGITCMGMVACSDDDVPGDDNKRRIHRHRILT